MMAAPGKSAAASNAGPGSVLSAQARDARAIVVLQKKIWEAGSSVSAVCRRANVDERHFQRALLGEKTASRWFIRRCELALDSLLSGEGMPADPGENHLRAHYRAFQHQLADALGAAGADPDDRRPTGTAALARHAAWYLLSTEFAVRPARIADLFGVTRAAVTQALQAIEDRRDEPAFDAALETIGRRIMGRT